MDFNMENNEDKLNEINELLYHLYKTAKNFNHIQKVLLADLYFKIREFIVLVDGKYEVKKQLDSDIYETTYNTTKNYIERIEESKSLILLV